MTHLWNRVFHFILRFQPTAIPTDFHPQAPPDEVVRQRCKWQLEETLELLEACFGRDQFDWERNDIAKAKNILDGVCEYGKVYVDMVKYADANADIRYVAYGNDIAAGIDSRETDAEVARSNDSKSPPEQPGGKVLKGPKYQPPQIAAILKEQGWNPEK